MIFWAFFLKILMKFSQNIHAFQIIVNSSFKLLPPHFLSQMFFCGPLLIGLPVLHTLTAAFKQTRKRSKMGCYAD